MIGYRDRIDLDPEIGDAGALGVVSFLEGIAVEVEVDPPAVTFELAADDLWDLREMLEEIAVELGSRGVHYTPDKLKLVVRIGK